MFIWWREILEKIGLRESRAAEAQCFANCKIISVNKRQEEGGKYSLKLDLKMT